MNSVENSTLLWFWNETAVLNILDDWAGLALDLWHYL